MWEVDPSHHYENLVEIDTFMLLWTEGSHMQESGNQADQAHQAFRLSISPKPYWNSLVNTKIMRDIGDIILSNDLTLVIRVLPNPTRVVSIRYWVVCIFSTKLTWFRNPWNCAWVPKNFTRRLFLCFFGKLCCNFTGVTSSWWALWLNSSSCVF